MVEKMEFLRITGPKDDIDRFNSKYLSKHSIHLENALNELSGVLGIKPFVEINPHKEYLAQAENLVSMLEDSSVCTHKEMEIEKAIEIINTTHEKIEEIIKEKEEKEKYRMKLEKLVEEIEPFRLLDYDLKEILNFKYIKFRFGRIAHEYYQKFSKYGYENINTIFCECDRDAVYVWGIYFVPESVAINVDAIYSSLHFERLYIADEYEGTPEQAYQKLIKKIKECNQKIDGINHTIDEKLQLVKEDIVSAYEVLKKYAKDFNIRKMAVCTKEHARGSVFYILCGWMNRKDAEAFIREIEDDPKIFCLVDEDIEKMDVIPPTKLKNPKIIKPFELFVRMYGLPAYTEMDPTWFIAITYTLIFGIMFGDVGQGVLLFIGGFLLYKFKNMSIAGVISLAGLWSIFFGAMYGSVFGDEELIHAVWKPPMEDIMSTLILSICFGIILILIAMVMHIINAIKERDLESLFFDPSGFPGLICYGTVVVAILLVYGGYPKPGSILLGVLIGLPLIAIIFKEPLGRLIKRKRALKEGTGIVMFLIEALVEGFDVVLSYATNTISFVRVGAFALSHAGMMGVVFTLAGATKGDPNIIVLIIGNIVVMALEGLVVGIQVLRLEYYEMFSRFYRGNGKEFKPFK